MPGAPTVQLRQLVLRFGERIVLDHVDLDVFPGEVVAVVGASGSGKSSLLLCAGGLLEPASGSVHIGDIEISGASRRRRDDVRRRHLGFVYQFGELVPELNLVENVGLPLRLLGASRSEAERVAQCWLDRFGVGGVSEGLPTQVSGGEMQRAAIARALIHSPVAILADEPTGALDDDNGSAVFDALLAAAHDAGTSVVVVTHDSALARRADRRMLLSDGQLRSA